MGNPYNFEVVAIVTILQIIFILSVQQNYCYGRQFDSYSPFVLQNQGYHTGQEKTQVRLPRASKFCSWASENGKVWWPGGQVKLASAVLLVIIPVKNNLKT